MLFPGKMMLILNPFSHYQCEFSMSRSIYIEPAKLILTFNSPVKSEGYGLSDQTVDLQIVLLSLAQYLLAVYFQQRLGLISNL